MRGTRRYPGTGERLEGATTHTQRATQRALPEPEPEPEPATSTRQARRQGMLARSGSLSSVIYEPPSPDQAFGSWLGSS